MISQQLSHHRILEEIGRGGRSHQAATYFERVVGQDPTHGRALQHLAQLYLD